MSGAATLTNIHASAVVLGDRGIVITGASGVGKTQLALALICHAEAAGSFGRLVADDQLFLSEHGGRLVAHAPDTIAGLVEARGIGPVRIAFERKAPVDLVVRLVGRDAAERLPQPKMETLLGCELPLLELGLVDRQAAVNAIAARLAIAPFG